MAWFLIDEITIIHPIKNRSNQYQTDVSPPILANSYGTALVDPGKATGFYRQKDRNRSIQTASPRSRTQPYHFPVIRKCLARDFRHSRFTYREKDKKPFLTLLAENTFRSGIPEEDVMKWLPVHTQFLPFETEIRTMVRNVYRLWSGCGGTTFLPVFPFARSRRERWIASCRRNTEAHRTTK